MYYVYFFDFLNEDNRVLCSNLKNSNRPEDLLKYLENQPEISRVDFGTIKEAREFMKAMPPQSEFFAFTDSNFNYILQSKKCKEMRQVYDTTFNPAIEILKFIAKCE